MLSWKVCENGRQYFFVYLRLAMESMEKFTSRMHAKFNFFHELHGHTKKEIQLNINSYYW